METVQKPPTIAGRLLAAFSSPEKDWPRDVFIIFSAWIAVRLPLLVFRVSPFVQCDSYCFQTYQNTLRRPHYPFLYGQFIEFFGHVPAMLIQHVLVLLSALLLYLVGTGLAGRAGGLCAGVFCAVYGGFVLYAHSIMSETLFNFFLVCHLAAFWMAVKQEDARIKWYGPWCVAAGFFIAVSANVRPVIQYQVPVLCIALYPFYRSGERFRRLCKMMILVTAGFLVVYLYVAQETYRNYGLFGISSGLPKAAMYRLVYDGKAPVSGVKTSDPRLAAVRDYLARVGPDDDMIWLEAYTHIKMGILPRFQGGRLASDLETDRVITVLWRKYVLTYPWEYFRFSMNELVQPLVYVETFSGLLEFSQKMSRDGRVPPSKDAVKFLRNFYYSLSSKLGNIFFVVFGAFAGVLFLGKEKRPKNIFMACLLLTMFFIYVPQFFASIGMLRYRYPFDMVFFLAAGAGFSRLSFKTARKWARVRIAPGGGK